MLFAQRPRHERSLGSVQLDSSLTMLIERSLGSRPMDRQKAVDWMMDMMTSTPSTLRQRDGQDG